LYKTEPIKVRGSISTI